MFECTQCSKSFKRLWNLQRPASVQHRPGNSESQILQRGYGVKRQRVESSSEDRESDYEQSDGEYSGIENCDELNREINCESEMESSESEGENDEVTMDDEYRQKVRVDWPISQTYRIRYSWSFWGGIPHIKKHIRWLERLRDAEKPTVIYNIKNASKSQLAALCEIAYNCSRGHVPLERWCLKELRNHRRSVHLLANPDVDIEEKRDEMLRRGASFIETLLYTINPLMLFNIPRAMEPVVHEVEEEEDDEERED